MNFPTFIYGLISRFFIALYQTKKNPYFIASILFLIYFINKARASNCNSNQQKSEIWGSIGSVN